MLGGQQRWHWASLRVAAQQGDRVPQCFTSLLGALIFPGLALFRASKGLNAYSLGGPGATPRLQPWALFRQISSRTCKLPHPCPLGSVTREASSGEQQQIAGQHIIPLFFRMQTLVECCLRSQLRIYFVIYMSTLFTEKMERPECHGRDVHRCARVHVIGGCSWQRTKRRAEGRKGLIDL